MRRITLWLLSTVAVVVLLFSYRTSTDSTLPGGGAAAFGGGSGTSGGADGGPGGPLGTGSGTGSGGTGSGSTGSGSSTGGSSTSDGGGGTYRGSVAQTRWGPVQVSITVTNGRITTVSVPTYPNNNRRDQQINAYALPILKQATLQAQSADIDSVSGATVTSDGYISSLQAALDAAHLR